MATTIAAAAQKPVIPARQWKELKAHILSLYVDKNWPLRLVRQELATKGFEPSESQYRTRFKEWKIHKNRKLKTAKRMPTINVAAQEAPCHLCSTTVQRTAPLHHNPSSGNQGGAYPFSTLAADGIDNQDNNNDDWDPVGLHKHQEAAYPYFAGEAAGRIDNDDDNIAGLVGKQSRGTVGESFNIPKTTNRSNVYHAELHPNLGATSPYRMQIDGRNQDDTLEMQVFHGETLPMGNHSSLELGWEELEQYPDQ